MLRSVKRKSKDFVFDVIFILLSIAFIVTAVPTAVNNLFKAFLNIELELPNLIYVNLVSVGLMVILLLILKVYADRMAKSKNMPD